MGTYLLASILLAWQTPTAREDGTPLYVEEIAFYTLREEAKIIEYITGNSIEIALPRKKCKDYTVSATDVANQESAPSNTIQLCKRKGRKERK
jgi:hypothetical protein